MKREIKQPQINLAMPKEFFEILKKRVEKQRYESIQALIRQILRREFRKELVDDGKN